MTLHESEQLKGKLKSNYSQSKHHRHTLLKVVAWIAGCLIVIAGAIVWGVCEYLSPERITRLIEEKSGEYLNAEIKIGKLDYHVRKSYPWLEFEVDSLEVISKSLEGVSPDLQKQLPLYSDSLASIVKLQGKINLHALWRDKIQLKDLEIVKPAANIVMVNDSISNFTILKHSLPDKFKQPEIDLSEIKVISPVNFNFFSLGDDIQAKLEVENFYLAKLAAYTYKIGFEGVVNGHYQNYILQDNLPIKFTTELTPSPQDLSANLDNLSLSYGGLKLDMKGDVKTNKRGMELSNVKLNVDIDDVFTFLTQLPSPITDKIKIPEGINGHLPISVTLSLNSPYEINQNKLKNFTLHDLPLFSAIVNIKDANLNLTPTHGKKIEADNLYLIMECNYDPYNSEQTYLTIAEVRMKGEGISLEGVAHISNLTGDMQSFTGNVNFQTPLVESLAYFIPSSPVNLAGYLKGEVNFSGEAIEYGQKGLKDIAIAGDIKSNSLKVKSGRSGNLSLKNVKTIFNASIPSYPLTSYTGTKLGFDFSADSIVSKAPGMNLLLGKLNLKLDAADTVSGSPDPYGVLKINAGSVNANLEGNEIAAQNLKIEASGMLNSSSSGTYTSVSPSNGGNDELIASRIKHTPLVVEYDGGGILQTIMTMVSLNTNVKIQKGTFNTPAYLYPVEFSDVDLSSDLNNLDLQARNIKISDTGVSLRSHIEGLKPFMTSFSATPLKIRSDLKFTNVDINQLSWGYYGALISHEEPVDSVFYAPSMTPLTAQDSVCVAIPRNIDANIRLFSDAAEYMQYKFFPLSTDIIVNNGVATLSNLTVGTPYCTAVVDWTYSTAQLDNIFMNLKAKVKDFEFAEFYPVFPSLIDKTPELKDFTGTINADINCRFDMFPDMFMNPQSLAGNFDIKGSHLQFARQGKIEKITHLMLIEGTEPILIENININGGFHDDLLQVNPFKIKFDEYQLGVGGVNNTAGDIYYHLALEKSPFHLPFGVTLKGKMSHPEVRVGGTHINDKETEEVTTNLTSNLNINIMSYLRHGWLLFIQEAAKYEGGIK